MSGSRTEFGAWIPSLAIARCRPHGRPESGCDAHNAFAFVLRTSVRKTEGWRAQRGRPCVVMRAPREWILNELGDVLLDPITAGN